MKIESQNFIIKFHSKLNEKDANRIIKLNGNSDAVLISYFFIREEFQNILNEKEKEKENLFSGKEKENLFSEIKNKSDSEK